MPSTLAPPAPIPAPATPDERAREWAVITGLTVPQMKHLWAEWVEWHALAAR